MADAFGLLSVPSLAVDADRLDALPGRSVVDRISRVATAGVVVKEVCLVFIAFCYAAFISEVVFLPSLATSFEVGTFMHVRVPLCLYWTVRNLSLIHI